MGPLGIGSIGSRLAHARGYFGEDSLDLSGVRRLGQVVVEARLRGALSILGLAPS
jgi:hypothetical protein